MKIINTPCSRSALAIDATMTAMGWVGLIYLIAQGVMSVTHAAERSSETPFITTALPTIQTLMIYLTIAAFNALILLLWARYHKALFRNLRRQAVPLALDDETLASHFSLTRNALLELQDSRITVIHHAEDGGITQLETDQLRVRFDDNNFFEKARAA